MSDVRRMSVAVRRLVDFIGAKMVEEDTEMVLVLLERAGGPCVTSEVLEARRRAEGRDIVHTSPHKVFHLSHLYTLTSCFIK
jgi:hypothetical protein